MTTTLAIINESKRLSAADVAKMVSAVHGQAIHDAAPLLGLHVPTFASKATKSAVTLLIVDNPDVAGALGYHDVDPQGNAYGRVFVDPVLDNGGSALGDKGDPSLAVSAVLSHEVLEWWVDPFCQLWADAGTKSVAYEVGDPVQGDSYMVNGVSVSNFVTPAWFNPKAEHGPYDAMGKVSKPFTLTPGGYWIEMADGKVKQVFAEDRHAGASTPFAAATLAATKLHPASRTYRRLQALPDTSSDPVLLRIEVFKRGDGRFGWRGIAFNGALVTGDDGQGYENRVDSSTMARRLHPGVDLIDLTDAEQRA